MKRKEKPYRLRKLAERKFFLMLIILAFVSWGLWITKGFLQAGHLGSITKANKEITASVIFAPQPLRVGTISFGIYLAGLDHQPIRHAKISLAFRPEEDVSKEETRKEIDEELLFPALPAGEGSVFYNATDNAYKAGIWVLDLYVERSVFGDAHMRYRIRIEKKKE